MAVKAHIATAFHWAARHDLPPTRIVGSEFGCMRRWADCGTYLEDVIDAVESFGGHWAFCAFREDEWDGMDYELPADFPPGRFYWLMQSGQLAQIPRNGELMRRLQRRTAANPAARGTSPMRRRPSPGKPRDRTASVACPRVTG